MADMKIGAYICKGCGIGERLNTAQLANIATKEGKAGIAREHEFLCNASGVDMIKQDIEKEGVNHVVIAACSRRAKAETFNFENVAINRTNLREGVIWVTPADEDKKEIVQEMAADYVRMGCAEVKKMEVAQANPSHGNNKRILVVGGGISGMTAAIEAANTGYDVLLVEKTGSLGGMAAKLAKRVPFREPYSDPVDTGIADLIKKIEGEKHIKVFLNSTISKTSGAPGQFSVDISTESGSTAQWLSRVRSAVPIFAFSPNANSRRRMAMFRDVYPVHLESRSTDADQVIRDALRKLWRTGAVVAGDRVIVTMGDQTGESGGTNTLRLIRLDSDGGSESETKLDLG